ncbi:MAG: hypothetical protein PF961_06690 [Planctomycetota bacterium]|nr:hypothetical protein [Planctomycetota bacterium]
MVLFTIWGWRVVDHFGISASKLGDTAQETSIPPQVQTPHEDTGDSMSISLDFSIIELEGDGYRVDTFCLSVAAAARLLGSSVSYDDVLMATGNGFAPGFDTGNDCKELWVGQAWVSHLGQNDSGWEWLGLEVRQLRHADHPNRPETYTADLCAVIRESLDAGKVVIAAGGWDARKVEPWWGGIVTEVHDDNTVWGVHPSGNGQLFRVVPESGELFAVSLEGQPYVRRALARKILQNAVNRIRAKGPAGCYGKHEFCAFGMDAMDEWIRQMQVQRHFCPVCQRNNGAGWKSAEKVALAAFHRSDVAASWLRENADLFPASESILHAAACYDRIGLALAPFVPTQGVAKRSYERIIGDLALQAEHARGVLGVVREELTQVADIFEASLGIEEGDARRVVTDGF